MFIQHRTLILGTVRASPALCTAIPKREVVSISFRGLEDIGAETSHVALRQKSDDGVRIFLSV